MMKPISVWKQELAGGTHTARLASLYCCSPEQTAAQAPPKGLASPDQLKTVTDILRACQIKPDEADAFVQKILHDQTVTSVSLTAVQAQTFINEYHKHMQQQGAAR